MARPPRLYNLESGAPTYSAQKTPERERCWRVFSPGSKVLRFETQEAAERAAGFRRARGFRAVVVPPG